MSEIDMQKIIDTMSATMRFTRINYHLTLGKLIEYLKKVPDDRPVELTGGGSPGRAHSYRGYYSDLSFEPSSQPITVGRFRVECQAALDATFEGYKGGLFVMDCNTPLWSAPYGSSGEAIVGITIVDDWRVLLITKVVED